MLTHAAQSICSHKRSSASLWIDTIVDPQPGKIQYNYMGDVCPSQHVVRHIERRREVHGGRGRGRYCGPRGAACVRIQSSNQNKGHEVIEGV
jgi:hypothetical protein